MPYPESLHSAISSERAEKLRAQFGELLNLRDLAALLRYPSLHAIRKARLRGTLRIPLIQIAGRRGWFAPVRGVATYLESLDASCGTKKEAEMN
jgi:hypothetical protein